MEKTGTSSKKMTDTKIRDICYIALFTALIAVLTQFTIPMPLGVPMTLQTLIVPLAGVILGKKNGTISILVYLLIGCVGLPVFSGSKGGVGVLAGPTGGFIIGFIAMAFIAGCFAEMKNRGLLLVGLILAAVADYTIGVVMFMIQLQKPLTVALEGCVLPFIPTEIIKIAIVFLAGPMIRKQLMRANLI